MASIALNKACGSPFRRFGQSALHALVPSGAAGTCAPQLPAS